MKSLSTHAPAAGTSGVLAWMMFLSFLMAAPLFLAGILSTGSATVMFLAIGAATMFGSSSLITVEAQSLLPAHASMAAGLMMGVSMGIGGLLVGPVSAAAQTFGIVPVLTVVSLLPIPGSLITLSLSRETRLVPASASD